MVSSEENPQVYQMKYIGGNPIYFTSSYGRLLASATDSHFSSFMIAIVD